MQAKVTVYHFKTYDSETEQSDTSKSRATLTAILRAMGTPLPETALEVDEDDLDPDGFYRPVD